MRIYKNSIFYIYEYKLSIHMNTNLVFIHLEKRKISRTEKKPEKLQTEQRKNRRKKTKQKQKKTRWKNQPNKNKKKGKNKKFAPPSGASPPPLRARHVSSRAGREARDLSPNSNPAYYHHLDQSKLQKGPWAMARKPTRPVSPKVADFPSR